MTRQRALRLAREWSQGHVCSLRDGEAAEYHSMFAAMLEEAPPNEPLTIEELREMNGESVWIVEPPGWGHWELSADAEDYIEDRDQDLYGLKHDDPAGQCGLHVLGWLAYRRPPEGGEINKITVVQYLGRLGDVAFRPVSREQVEKVFPGCEKCRNQANWPSWIEKGFVYCPKCGTPLTSWAWEKQVERLEALKDGDLE